VSKSNAARAANVAAALVIVAAGMLSAWWAFLVPIFQATDEAAHYDYAMGIFAAGRLVGIRDRPHAWIATPYARYLLGATDYFRVAFHSSMRAPYGYGTAAYYRRLDAGAPSVRPPLDSGKISYIGYPFGFYALQAAVASVVARATGSLTATFFGARLLCVFLTMIGLYFSYRTAINIGVPRWISVALIAATGFFPLTTLVSSYVQPDNLSFALAAAASFLATQYERGSRPQIAILWLALVLGALAVTKYQFFVSVAVPVILLVIFCPRSRVPVRTTLLRVIAVTVPAVVAILIQFLFVNRRPWLPNPPGSAAVGASPGVPATIIGLFRSGPAPALSYLLHNSFNAFRDFYVSGPNAATYWGALGLWDVPLVIGNERIEFFLRTVISLASVTVVAVVIYRIVSNVMRLRRLALRNRRETALRLAFSDPLFNSYVLFTALLFALYAATGNIFGAVGRQWYPYNFAAFLCAAWYAPRSFKGLSRRTPGALAAVLAAYSVVASVYATESIVKRYYGPQGATYTTLVPKQSETVPDGAIGTLWPIQGMDFHPLFAKRYRTTFVLGSRLWAGGAAIFPSSHRAANTIAVVIDGRVPARVLAGQYNFQIAEATRDLTYGYSGFFAPFDTRALTEGPHVAIAYAKLPDRESFQTLSPDREFFLTGRGALFSQTFLLQLRRAVRLRNLSATIHPCGALLAITGSASGAAKGRTPHFWSEADGRPYTGSYDDKTQRFLSAVPLNDFDAGYHRVNVYVTYPNLQTAHVATTLGVESRRDVAAQTVPSDALCTAAERLIAGM
jgi:hypothetical protein